MTLFPAAWKRIAGLEGLDAGFGDRDDRAPRPCVLVRQVHGATVAAVDVLEPGREHAHVEADALVVTRAGAIGAVKTADCVPLLLVAAPAVGVRWAAAVHAGWRGTIAGVAAAALADARRRGVAPAEVLAAAGPAIGGCCYEVDEDVAARFRRARLPVVEALPKPRLDLRAINRELLVREGVEPRNIRTCGPCTRCRSDRYHSYRAAPGRAGRQLSWIGWRA
jgi:YfiH family protein